MQWVLSKLHQNPATSICDFKNFPGGNTPGPPLKGGGRGGRGRGERRKGRGRGRERGEGRGKEREGGVGKGGKGIWPPMKIP